MSDDFFPAYLPAVGRAPRRRSLIRFFPGDPSKAWKPRGLRVLGIFIPLPVFRTPQP